MVGKTFSSRPARALRSKGFSALSICATVLPFRKTRCAVCAFSSFASAMQRLRLSGFMPINVPVNVFPIVVETLTVLSTNAATSVWNFLSATDIFSFSVPMLTKLHFNYLSLIQEKVFIFLVGSFGEI